MISKVNLVLSGIVYCLKGMAVSVKEKTGKYSIIERTEIINEKPKVISFKVSNELKPFYFEEE
nr:MAG TPA: hypothetical protein [Caudoviricetes sp.]